MNKKNAISWKAYDYEYVPKTADWYWVVSIIFLALASIFWFFFQDQIFSSLLVVIWIVLIIASRKKPSFKKYEISPTEFKLDGGKTKIDFKDIESYLVNQDHRKILINTKNKYQPLILIPFEKSQNMGRVDSFLQTKLKKNPELKIPTIELIFSRFFGF